MKLKLERIETPFVMEISNETGNTCLIDANTSFGGKNKGLRPMEMLAGALAGCISVDVLNILKKKRIEPSVFKVLIEGVRAGGIPAPFEKIHLLFELDSKIEQDKLIQTIESTIDKYCSVSASLDKSIQITYSIKFNPQS